MTAVTDRTPALADLAEDHWTEQDMAAWLWQMAQEQDTSSTEERNGS
jgi:hypothetical protein